VWCVAVGFQILLQASQVSLGVMVGWGLELPALVIEWIDSFIMLGTLSLENACQRRGSSSMVRPSFTLVI